jgi:hypothetical protein
MVQRIVLLIGSFIFLLTSPAVKSVQEEAPAQSKFSIKTVQLLAKDSDIVIVTEAKEKYILHLHPPFPAVEKESKERERRLLLFSSAYEAVLQQRFLELLISKIVFSTSAYDKRQNQENKDGSRPKRLETFFWDVPDQKLSTEITIGTLKDRDEVIANEKLGYSFDLKTNTITCDKKGLLSSKMELEDEEMLSRFLDFLVTYSSESIEWYEVEMGKVKKDLPPPEKKSEKKKIITANNFFAGSFYSHPEF